MNERVLQVECERHQKNLMRIHDSFFEAYGELKTFEEEFFAAVSDLPIEMRTEAREYVMADLMTTLKHAEYSALEVIRFLQRLIGQEPRGTE